MKRHRKEDGKISHFLESGRGNGKEICAAVISFTDRGNQLAAQISTALQDCAKVKTQDSRQLCYPLKEWCQRSFASCQLLVFVGAVGIAVRLIAEFIQDKYQDPAVLVIDELGNYVIPVLSGHVGGGNDWARFLGEALGALPVITTATDLHGKFAVDVFAAKNKLVISERGLAKEISAAVLRGEAIRFFSEREVFGRMPKELQVMQLFPDNKQKAQAERSAETCQEPEATAAQQRAWGGYSIYVGVKRQTDMEKTLFLHPKALALGIGCRKGKSSEEIEAFVLRTLQEAGLAWDSVCGVASVELKKQEQGLVEFCEKWKLSFCTFTPEQLAKVPGTFSESSFVQQEIGIGNVCERAAVVYASSLMKGTKKPALRLPKMAGHGITLAAAEIDWSVQVEEVICGGNRTRSL